MKIALNSSMALCLALAASASAFAFEKPDLTPEEIETLKSGETIMEVWKDRERDHKPTVTRGGIDIMASTADVFAIMYDCDRMQQVSPDIRLCEVLETSPDGSWDIRKQKFAVSPILPKFKSIFKTSYSAGPNQGHILQIEKISGDLKVQEGRWDIIPLGPDHTRVIYQAAIKPSLPIPAKTIRKQVAIGIPDILRSLRDIAETDSLRLTQNDSAPMPVETDDSDDM